MDCVQTVSAIEVVIPDPSELLIEGKVKCPLPTCSTEVKSSSCLAFHLKKHQSEGALDHHLQASSKSHGNTIFYCPVSGCGRARESGQFFYAKSQLKAHYTLMHAEKTYSCNQCGKKYGMESSLKRHERECGFRFYCSVCGQSFNMRNSLHMHMKRKGHMPGYSVPVSSTGSSLPEGESNVVDIEDEEEEMDAVVQQRTSSTSSSVGCGSPVLLNSSSSDDPSNQGSEELHSPQEGVFSPVLDHVDTLNVQSCGNSTTVEIEPSFNGVQTIVTQVTIDDDLENTPRTVAAATATAASKQMDFFNLADNIASFTSPPATLSIRPPATQGGSEMPPAKRPFAASTSPDQDGYLFKCSTCSKVYTKRNSVYVHQHRKGHKGNVVRLRATDVEIVSDGDGFSLKSPFPSDVNRRVCLDSQQTSRNVGSFNQPPQPTAKFGNNYSTSLQSFQEVLSRHHAVAQLANRPPLTGYSPRPVAATAKVPVDFSRTLPQHIPRPFQPNPRLQEKLNPELDPYQSFKQPNSRVQEKRNLELDSNHFQLFRQPNPRLQEELHPEPDHSESFRQPNPRLQEKLNPEPSPNHSQSFRQPNSRLQEKRHHEPEQNHSQLLRPVPDSVGEFKCPKCQKSYNSPGALIAHNRDAHCDLCFKCDDCGKVYWFKNSLLTHQKRKSHSGCTKIAADIYCDTAMPVPQKADSLEVTNMDDGGIDSPELPSTLPLLPTITSNFMSTKWEVPSKDSGDDPASDSTQYVVIPVVAPLNQTMSAFPQFSLIQPPSKRKRPRTRITEEELVLSRKVQTTEASCQTDSPPSPSMRLRSNIGLQTDKFLICSASLSSVHVQTCNEPPSTCVTDLLELGTQTEWSDTHRMDDLLQLGTQTPSFLRDSDHPSQTSLY